ncbi:MAG: HAD-IIB family hydrolase [Firmicutes bacterium]|jgi:HAD superfamily hydrolase (TIGR01484 family)|nr:HAD-IIB family hydrolase [Bacillota bacterium]
MRKPFICDVDGCLVPPRGHKWDFRSLAVLADRIGEREFTFTLCSGRPATFMEALARQLTITSPLICENGSLLFDPLTKRGMLHPNIPPEFMKERPHIRRTIEELIAGTDALIELGKDVMFSVNSTNPGQFGDLMPKLKDALLGAPVEIQFSGRSIEVIPQGVTKAQGLAFWAETTGAAVTDTVSIGDADNDLEILKAAGHAAAPANCTPNVQSIAEYVSPYSMVEGVLDIITNYLARS